MLVSVAEGPVSAVLVLASVDEAAMSVPSFVERELMLGPPVELGVFVLCSAFLLMELVAFDPSPLMLDVSPEDEASFARGPPGG